MEAKVSVGKYTRGIVSSGIMNIVPEVLLFGQDYFSFTLYTFILIFGFQIKNLMDKAQRTNLIGAIAWWAIFITSQAELKKLVDVRSNQFWIITLSFIGASLISFIRGQNSRV